MVGDRWPPEAGRADVFRDESRRDDILDRCEHVGVARRAGHLADAGEIGVVAGSDRELGTVGDRRIERAGRHADEERSPPLTGRGGQPVGADRSGHVAVDGVASFGSVEGDQSDAAASFVRPLKRLLELICTPKRICAKKGVARSERPDYLASKLWRSLCGKQSSFLEQSRGKFSPTFDGRD